MAAFYGVGTTTKGTEIQPDGETTKLLDPADRPRGSVEKGKRLLPASEMGKKSDVDLLAAVRSGASEKPAPAQTSAKPVKELNIRLRPSANGSHLATVNGTDTYILDQTRVTDMLEALCGRDLDNDND